jgi:hydroxymethylbilane synthase
LDGRVDLAVHSMKDVPAELPQGLHVAVVPKREKPFDAFISRKYKTLAELPLRATVGTSSLRRKAQLAALRPDVQIQDLRGNLDTRLRKLDEGMYEAIILAAAGLNRLQMHERITALFSPEQMLPAIGQGALGIELRKTDKELLNSLQFLHHADTAAAVAAERALLHRLEGGCQVPIGGFATVADGTVRLTGLIAALDGKTVFKEQLAGSVASAAEIGTTLAETLLAAGGKAVLDEVYAAGAD